MEQNTQTEEEIKVFEVTLPIGYTAVRTTTLMELVSDKARAESEKDGFQSRFWDYRTRNEESLKKLEELTAENKKLAAEIENYKAYFNNQVGAKADYVMWLNGREDEEV